MTAMLSRLLDLLPLGFWMILWGLGGILIVRRAFNLYPREQALAGFGVGMVLQNWLANLLAHWIPTPQVFWVATGIIFVAGILSWAPFSRPRLKEMFRIPFNPWKWVALVGLTVFLTLVGRGMAILDDYQNLPMTSLLATGDIPPHFALDPKIIFNYHYFTLLFAAQLMRVGQMYVWMALDTARALGFSVALLLGYDYTRRITRSQLAGFLTVLMGLFAGGTRWLFLLLPPDFLHTLSAQIKMIGSAATSAGSFYNALMGVWQVETGSPFPLPFAFANGINTPGIWLFHAGAGALEGITTAFLLLSHNRWRGWRAGVTTAALLAALAIGSELTVVLMGVGFFLLAVIEAFRRKTLRIPAGLWKWLVVFLAVAVFSAFQGGVLTGAVSDLINRFLPGGGTASSYFTGGFRILWPPVLLSSHLGYLSLTNPYQALAAFFEVGPLVLVLPLVLIWGYKTYHWKRWYEASLFLMAVLSIFWSFVDYTGSAGPTAITRVQGALITLPKGWAVPVMWIWLRKRSTGLKTASASLFAVSMITGLVMLGYQLIGAARPTFGVFLSVLDAQMTNRYWNRLEPGVLIFDPITSRAPTIFGRPTDSNLTWYTEKPEWVQLAKEADPYSLRAYGFSYAYLDRKYWDEFNGEVQKAWEEDDCVHLVDQVEYAGPYDFRRLYDIRNCIH